METSENNDANETRGADFKLFATKRVIVGILATVAVLWIVVTVLGFFDEPGIKQVAEHPETDQAKTEAVHKPGPQPHAAAPETVKDKASQATVHYKEGTAGHMMSSDFIAMGEDTPAGEVISTLKKEHRDLKQSFRVYVVDPHDKLVGIVSIKELMFATATTPLKSFMSPNVISITTGTDKEKVARLMTRESLKALPVVDSNKQLIGVVRAKGVVIPAKEEHAATAPEKPHAEEHAATAPEKPHAKEPAHPAAPHGGAIAKPAKPRAKGVAFMEATIHPLSHELHDRFWGWRPNDILNFTDNVNNFQLGVLEVTRRTAVILAERISRTGSTAAFDHNLENAMNWFMVKSNRYWFPSPESKYRAGLKELEIYKERLEKGEAKFYTRTDNLIPLLMAYEDLLGSCDENLVKHLEDDGTPVSFFKADDYFFYAKGVASGMLHILEAIMEDFHNIIETRRGLEVLHHAIEACHEATEIDPWVITNADSSSVFANHRANMAAPISHTRFYIGVLIKTLST